MVSLIKEEPTVRDAVVEPFIGATIFRTPSGIGDDLCLAEITAKLDPPMTSTE